MLGPSRAALVRVRMAERAQVVTLLHAAQVISSGLRHLQAPAPAGGPGKLEQGAVAQAVHAFVGGGEDRMQRLLGKGRLLAGTRAASPPELDFSHRAAVSGSSISASRRLLLNCANRSAGARTQSSNGTPSARRMRSMLVMCARALAGSPARICREVLPATSGAMPINGWPVLIALSCTSAARSR